MHKKIISFVDTQIQSILQFMNDKRMNDIKELAKSKDFYKFDI